MANYSNLKKIIDQVVRTNGQGEITGANLNQTLQEMVTSLGANYQYAGVATPSTNPGSPDQNVFYIASLAGTYTNFGGVTIPKGISVLRWNGSWSLTTLYTVDTGLTPNSDALVQSGTVFEKFKFDGGAYDVSAHFPTGGVGGGNTYTFDSAVAKVPQDMRMGGMSIRFIDNSDNNYVQYTLLSDTFNTTVANWQGVDDVPTAGRKNLVESGGVYSVVTMNRTETVNVFLNWNSTSWEGGSGYMIDIADISKIEIKAGNNNAVYALLSDNNIAGSPSYIQGEITRYIPGNRTVAFLKPTDAKYLFVSLVGLGTDRTPAFIKLNEILINSSVNSADEIISKKIESLNSAIKNCDWWEHENGLSIGGTTWGSGYGLAFAIEGKKEVKFKATTNKTTVYAFLTKLYYEGTVPFVEGETQPLYVAGGSEETIQVPNDAVYLYVTINDGTTDRAPEAIEIDGFPYNYDLKSMIGELSASIANDIHIYTTDSQDTIFAKMLSAFNSGNKDVYFETGTYVFDSVFQLMKSQGYTNLELPIGGNCTYYLNGSTLIATRPSGDFTDPIKTLGTWRSVQSFELMDGTIICNDGSYCVHDEADGKEGYYKHLYKNIIMQYISGKHTTAYNRCIGGGCGRKADIIIEGCVFGTDQIGAGGLDVTWHIDFDWEAHDNVHNIKWLISNCYFSRGFEVVGNMPDGHNLFVQFSNNSYKELNLMNWKQSVFNNQLRES